ncbi:nucleoside 2-deoxyribosyltransferase domain-containing protein [Salibacter halophilus]|uniref:Nucleoside 2-deoxyribosyltransferase n=1 Tax=Salibacter halophilus TaxID=1803916 RepID=A0A6N6M726_9FLAO|nr:nucleoside 2-deoxyribosyltransferase domain-containing protein [Salibacter halophilus]KAB1065608.1 hypothetical protein F3059_02845 [Salibacter halophilus]
MKQTIYLAGGFRSNWQNQVIEKLGEKFVFYDPRKHGLADEVSYTVWDLHHIKHSSILLAYMEATNPSGYGLSLEVGYAKALFKTVILVDERSITDKKFSRYFGMIRVTADITFNSLNEALEYLESF